MARDYVHHSPAQFHLFLGHLIQYVQTQLEATPLVWTHILKDRFDQLGQRYGEFSQAFANHQTTPTPANTLARNEAQAEATRELRAFVNQFLRFPPVTNVDRVEMGVPNHDLIRTDHKVVTEMVDYVLHLRNIREIMVDFWIQGETHKAKPQGYDGAVIVWDLLDAHPETPNALNHHTILKLTA